MGYRLLRPRTWPLKQDKEKRAEFQGKLNIYKTNPDVEIWYQDESGFQGDPKLYRVWAKKGTRVLANYTGSHIKNNVIGAVRPDDGKFLSLIMPETNTQTFQIFLNYMNRRISRKKKVIMILDNASWHKTKSLKWGRIEPFYLPAYSPDYNPIERIWLHMKQTFFNLHPLKTNDELLDKLTFALRYFSNNKKVCKSLCEGVNGNSI